jgi:hypothetical protein
MGLALAVQEAGLGWAVQRLLENATASAGC